jgi:YXWGXW repeat-containing protein
MSGSRPVVVYEPPPAPLQPLVATLAPPPLIAEVRPAVPSPGVVWIPGFWSWTGGQYVWVAGRWSVPRPGFVWVASRWRPTGRHWRYVPGHWRHA